MGVSPTSSTRYLYDGWNRIAEYEENGTGHTLKSTYLWGMVLSGTMQGAGGVGGLLSMTLNSQPSPLNFYPTYDGNGNVSEYVDDNGDKVAHFEYDPFGNLTVDTEGNAGDFPYRFSTKPQDLTTGLYYYAYRYYDPTTGRWPSRDPIEEEGGINLYGFVRSDGINSSDYLGNVIITAEDKPYRDAVVIALKGITDKDYTWDEPYDTKGNTNLKKPKYWCLRESKGGGGELAVHISKGLNTTVVIDLINQGVNDDINNANAKIHAQYAPASIPLAVKSPTPIDSGKKDKYGEIEWTKTPPSEFQIILWHELVGHSIHNGSHTVEQDKLTDYWNIYEYSLVFRKKTEGKIDVAISYENMARNKLGLPMRRPEYWDSFQHAKITPPGDFAKDKIRWQEKRDKRLKR